MIATSAFASVIPYFLVINMVTKSYVYVYDGKVDITVITPIGIPVQNEVKGKINCYNSGESQLVCQIRNTTVESSVPLLKAEIERVVATLVHPFQINFNPEGVESVTVDSSISNRPLSYVKLIASLFHVGTYLNDTSKFPTFQGKDNGTFGPCDTKYTVTRHPLAEVLFDDVTNFKVVPLSSSDADHKIEIHKVTKPNHCSTVTEFLNKMNVGDEQVIIKPIKSNMEINLPFGKFKSNCTVEGTYIKEMDHRTMKKKAHVTASIRLESIEETNGDIPALPPSRTVDLIFPDFLKD